MFKVRMRNPLIPGFVRQDFASDEATFVVNGSRYFVKMFLGKFSSHPLQGDRDNMGTYQKTDSGEGFPLMVIQERGRQFGFGFYQQKWVYWNDNASWDAVSTVFTNPEFLVKLKEKTGFDFSALDRWNNLFLGKIHQTKAENERRSFEKGYGQVWMMDLMRLHEGNQVFRWKWRPNDPREVRVLRPGEKEKWDPDDPKYSILTLEAPIDLLGVDIHPAACFFFLEQPVENDSFSRVLINEYTDKREHFNRIFLDEAQNLNEEGEMCFDKKCLFGIQRKKAEAVSAFTIRIIVQLTEVAGHTKGVVKLEIYFEKQLSAHGHLFGDAFIAYSKSLLAQFLSILFIHKDEEV